MRRSKRSIHFAVYYPDVPMLEQVTEQKSQVKKEEEEQPAKDDVPKSMRNRPLPEIPSEVGCAEIL
jgi:hypothetical protein